MSEVSNKTLAVLLVAAIVVSLGGTYISLNKLNRGIDVSVTGRAVDDIGQVNLSIAKIISITMNDSLINFGTGSVSGDINAVCISYNDTTGQSERYNFTGDGPGCDNTAGDGYDILRIENDGSVPVNITVNMTVNGSTALAESDAADYFCLSETKYGAGDGGCNVADGAVADLLAYVPTQDGSDANCVHSETDSFSLSLSGTPQTICDGLDFSLQKRYFNISVKAIIPLDAEGYKTANLTFIAEENSTGDPETQ